MHATLHEGGHAFFMRRYGVEIDKMGIGLPINPKLQFRLRGVSFPLVVSPWLISAYVKMTNAGFVSMDSLPYGKRADINSAGIMANLISAFVLEMIFLAVVGGAVWKIAIAGIILTVFLIIFYKVFCRILIPFLGSALGIVVAYDLLQMMAKFFSQGSMASDDIGVGGPISIVVLIQSMKASIPGGMTGFFLQTGAILGFVFATTNMLPLRPLDGGNIFVDLVEKFFGGRVARVADWMGVLALLMIVALAFTADILKVFGR